MKIDAELAVMTQISLPDYADVAKVRAWLVSMMGYLGPGEAEQAGIEVEDKKIDGLDGGPPVPIRTYRPKAGCTGTLVYFHGGSMIMGDLDMEHGVCLRYAREAGCAVVGVAYRLAPEQRFPAAINDCLSAFLWASDNAATLGGRPEVAVCGHSSGGTLTAALSIMTRDRGGPAPALQMLIYPALDDRMVEPSLHQGMEFDVPSRAVIGHMWRHYLGGEGQNASSYAVPARVSDLSGLAPAYIEAGAIDRVRDESIAYASRLLQAGIATDLHILAGAVHGFDTVTEARLTKMAYATRASVLRRAFNPQ